MHRRASRCSIRRPSHCHTDRTRPHIVRVGHTPGRTVLQIDRWKGRLLSRSLPSLLQFDAIQAIRSQQLESGLTLLLPLSIKCSTYLLNSPRHSISVHRNRSACPNQRCRGRNSRAGIAAPPCPLSHNPLPSSPSCRCTFPRRSIRGPCTSDADSPLM